MIFSRLGANEVKSYFASQCVGLSIGGVITPNSPKKRLEVMIQNERRQGDEVSKNNEKNF